MTQPKLLVRPSIECLLLTCFVMAMVSSLPAQVITIDNVAPAYTTVGSWSPSMNATFVGTNSQVSVTGTGSNTATWTPTIPVAGTYEVYAWWVAASNRATNSPYIIQHAAGQSTVIVDQRFNGSRWNLLGQWDFNAGSGSFVRLTNNASGPASPAFVSADAVMFRRVDGPCASGFDNFNYLSSGVTCNQCQFERLPGAPEPHPLTTYYIHSDLPERFLTTGVLYSTQAVLPPFNLNNGSPLSVAMRTQVNNGFTTVDDNFELFVFHITSPGDGTQPRRIVVYVQNLGTDTVTITPRQIMITDGVVANIHEMESNLGSRVLANDYDTPISSINIPAGQGDVIAYSKRFAGFPNGPDLSANVNCFGHVRAQVASSSTPNLRVYVIAIAGNTNLANNKPFAEALLGQGAQSGETAIDLSTAPSGCQLRRATGVFNTFVWRSSTVQLDATNLALLPRTYQMALPNIQAGGCATAQQTVNMLLYPPYVRPDTVGNYMVEYRLMFELTNPTPLAPYEIDLEFGKTGADVGLAWQVVTGSTPPSDAAVNAAPVRTAWAGPNQSSLRASFLAQDGGPITLAKCQNTFVAIRFLVLGNASLPFQIHATGSGPVPVDLNQFVLY